MLSVVFLLAVSTHCITSNPESYHLKVREQHMNLDQDTTQQKPKKSRPRPQLWSMPIGTRSVVALCEGRKTSMVASGTDPAWVPRLSPGRKLRLDFFHRIPAWAVIELTAVCRHDIIAAIPTCPAGHDPAAIDPEGTWDDILSKAMFGGGAPVDTAIIEQRSAKGWYVLDFKVLSQPKRWLPEHFAHRAEEGTGPGGSVES